MAKLIELSNFSQCLKEKDIQEKKADKLTKLFELAVNRSVRKLENSNIEKYISIIKRQTDLIILIKFRGRNQRILSYIKISISLQRNQIFSQTHFNYNGNICTIKTNKNILSFLPILMNFNKNLIAQTLNINISTTIIRLHDIITCSNLQNISILNFIKLINSKVHAHQKLINEYIDIMFYLMREQPAPGEDAIKINLKSQLMRNINISHEDFFLTKLNFQLNKNSQEVIEKVKLHQQRLQNKFYFHKDLTRLFAHDFLTSIKQEEFRDLHRIQQLKTKSFDDYLIVPMPKLIEEHDNKYLFNYIEVQKMKSQKKLTVQSGSCQLFYTMILFNYLDENGRKDKGNMSLIYGNKKLSKIVAFKKPIKNERTYANIINREVKIVQLLQNKASAFIIKYYLNKSSEAELNNKLFMDFLPKNTSLTRLLQNKSSYLLLRSKFHIFLNIAKGIMFLQDNKIVHMDLNPNNIIINQSDYLPKIIDFGQSYSKQLNNDQYYPGFTNPYGPPQVFTKRHFTSKQDVYSFGIMLFYMIFGFHPFQPTNKLKVAYREGKHLEKWFFAPECLDYFGSEGMIEIIFQFIQRCIGKEDRRPTPRWCVIIQKKISSIYYLPFRHGLI